MQLSLNEKRETITSLELVEIINKFRKQELKENELRHDTLLSIIRDEFKEEIGIQKILETPYIHPQNKQKYPMFILSFSQAKQLLIRESRLVRKAVIEYIEKLENKLKEKFQVPSNFKEALMLAVKQQEELEKLEQKIETDKPKVLFAEALEISKTSILVGELAKLIKQNGVEMGAKRLFEWLRKKGYLGNKGEQYNMPTQKSMELKIMEIKTTETVNTNGSIRINKTPKITGKGQSYFVNKFLKNTVMKGS
ncbi:phage antirepressor KilAC domain-containing protein [Streptobacillus ratti]|uniref:phage antirepressor KilAC domain-containing protein n=1 Tax=Streptobacillus ratti TaxID=1720557 RepID=UPI0009335036|nr:phage antirepressor KilAC domain-containing protein [Streptobacillus ratti]